MMPSFLHSVDFFHHFFFAVQLSPHNLCHSIVRIKYIVYHPVALSYIFMLCVVLYIPSSPIDHHCHLRSPIQRVTLSTGSKSAPGLAPAPRMGRVGF